MNLNERLERAQDRAAASFRVAEEADDEARGAEALGLVERVEACRDRARRHSELCAVWSATAGELRAERSTLDGCGFPIDGAGEVPPDLTDLTPQLNGRPT